MHTKALVLPSPYLIAPEPFYLDSRVILCSVLDEFTSAIKNSDLIQTVTDQILLEYCNLVVGEFYRQVIDSRFPSWKLHEELEPLILPEVGLWKSVFRMLENLSKHLPLTTYPALLLRELIKERELMVFIVTQSSETRRMKNYLALRQHQNRELQGCENPFDKEKSPNTWKIMDLAIKLANRDDDFRKKFYMPVVTARQKITAFMKKDKSRLIINGNMQRQGRKKEPIAQKS